MKRMVWVLVVLPGMAMAEFVPLSGADIEAALTDRSLIYLDGATQDFSASGRTRYTAGQPSWGYWAVRGDQYCSQWPPSDGWTCYTMARDGEVLRFIAGDGSRTDGVYAQ